MKKFFVFWLTISIFALSACTFMATDESGQNKIKVVTSFYPLYEIAKQVGGDYVEIKNLVPPGAEPHDYELTPKDIASVYESQILVVNGAALEPWLDRISTDLKNQSKTVVVDESKLFPDLVSGDPHLWMNPVQYSKEVDVFVKALSGVDPAHLDYYQTHAQRFKKLLADLDNEFKNGLQQCALHEFVTNHAAFGYLSKQYGLTMIPIAGLSPDAEPSVKTIADLLKLIQQKNVHYILTESLVSHKIADTIAAEAGAKTLVLNPLEGLTVDEMAQGKNYISVMQENLKNLQIALECK